MLELHSRPLIKNEVYMIFFIDFKYDFEKMHMDCFCNKQQI